MKTRQMEQAKGSEDGTRRANGRGNKAQGGEPPRQGERPCGAARATPEVGAQGALGRKGDMFSY